MTNVGVFNPNWRDGDVRRYVAELGKSTPRLCPCGNSTNGLPLYLVGKTDLCFSCYEADKLAKETYGPDWESEADQLRELLEPHAVDFASTLDTDPTAEARETAEDMARFGSQEPTLNLEPMNNAELRQAADWEAIPFPKDMPIIDVDNIDEIPF